MAFLEKRSGGFSTGLSTVTAFVCINETHAEASGIGSPMVKINNVSFFFRKVRKIKYRERHTRKLLLNFCKHDTSKIVENHSIDSFININQILFHLTGFEVIFWSEMSRILRIFQILVAHL